MRIFFAGAAGTEKREIRWQKMISNRLLSFWNVSRKEFSTDFAFDLIKKKHHDLVGGKHTIRTNRRSNSD